MAEPVIPDWTKDDGYDTLWLDGKPLPGVAEVSLKLNSGIDIQKPDGKVGARIVDKGEHPPQLHVKLTFPNVEELQLLMPFMPILRPRAKGAAKKPVSVMHPQAMIWGLDYVVIQDLEAPPPKSKTGYIIEFNLSQWVKDPPKVKKPANGPKPGGSLPSDEEQSRQIDAEKAKLLADQDRKARP